MCHLVCEFRIFYVWKSVCFNLIRSNFNEKPKYCSKQLIILYSSLGDLFDNGQLKWVSCNFGTKCRIWVRNFVIDCNSQYAKICFCCQGDSANLVQNGYEISLMLICSQIDTQKNLNNLVQSKIIHQSCLNFIDSKLLSRSNLLVSKLLGQYLPWK